VLQISTCSYFWSKHYSSLFCKYVRDEEASGAKFGRLATGNTYLCLYSAFNNYTYQCAIPVFDGLLPEAHNAIVMTLLFRLAEWHALAKLRMHSESTLTLMESATAALGDIMRKFRDATCSAFKTRELPKETAARGRRQTRKQVKKASQPEKLPAGAKPNIRSSAKDKSLNLATYKVHALADYVRTIRLFGTTDSYSTQTVGL
jgi:hypothetical protein